MKKFISILLTLSMMLSLLAIMPIASSAADDVTEQTGGELVYAELTIPEPVIGEAPEVVQVPEDASYTAEATWYNYTTDEIVTVFEDGQRYYADIIVIPSEGCSFSYDTEIVLNSEAYYDYFYISDSGEIYLSMQISFATPIDSIDITIPNYQPGDTFSIDDIVLGSDNYYIGYCYIYCKNAEDEDPYTFEDGNSYVLNIEIYGTNGYEVTEDTVVYINGTEAEECYVYTNADIYVEFSFLELITEADIPDFPEVNVGDSVTYEIYEVNEKYTVMGTWLTTDEDGNLSKFEGTIADQTVYIFGLVAIPNYGYEFSEDLIITQNGEEYNRASLIMSDMIMVFKAYTFGFETISTVELTTDEPADGVAIGEIAVADPDANYTLMMGYWGVSEDGSLDYIEDAEGNFENGKTYLLGAILVANEGYAFADDLTVTLNGKEYDIINDYTYIIGTSAEIAINLGRLGGILGDLNNDGKVNALDSAIMLKYIKSGETPADADINSDGKVNALDSALLLKIIKGKYVG